jgi:hypothetical protein
MPDPLSMADITRLGAIGGAALAGLAALTPASLALWRRRRARRAVASWEPWAAEHGWTYTPTNAHTALMEGPWRAGAGVIEAWAFEDAGRFEPPQLSLAFAPSPPLPAGLLIAPAGSLDRLAIPHGVFRASTGDAAFDRAFLVLGADVPAVQALLVPPRRRFLLDARSAKLEWTFKHDAFRLLLPAPYPAPVVQRLMDELADLSDRFIAAGV